MKSTPESGERAGYDGHKHKRGSKVHMAVDTLGLLLALVVTPANEQERRQVEQLAQKFQAVMGQSVEIAFVDQGYTGENAANTAKDEDIDLFVVRHEEAKKGFVLLPRRWVVERSFTWMSRLRRLACDYERPPETLAALHFLAFAMLMLNKALSAFAGYCGKCITRSNLRQGNRPDPLAAFVFIQLPACCYKPCLPRPFVRQAVSCS